MNIGDKILGMRKNPSLENVRKEAERVRNLAEKQNGGKAPKPEHRSYDLSRKFTPAPRVSMFKSNLK